MHWQSLSIWRLEQSEEGQYEQKTDLLVVNDGSIAAETEPKTIEKLAGISSGVKIIATLNAVPITEGDLLLRLFCRKIGEPDWAKIAEYPVTMVLARQ